MKMRYLTYLLLASASIAFLILFFYEFGLLLWIAKVLSLSLFLAVLVATVILALILLLAIPYFLIKKKPKTDEYGNYKLEDFKG
ncbi:MAG: hypothetical protein ACOC53_01230 [Candidatus Saliniplasma sp.]